MAESKTDDETEGLYFGDDREKPPGTRLTVNRRTRSLGRSAKFSVRATWVSRLLNHISRKKTKLVAVWAYLFVSIHKEKVCRTVYRISFAWMALYYVCAH